MAKRDENYKAGFDYAQEEIKTILVNGIDEFGTLPVFINTIVRLATGNAQFYEGVVDACTQAWEQAKKKEIADLEAERIETDMAFKETIDDLKRSA